MPSRSIISYYERNKEQTCFSFNALRRWGGRRVTLSSLNRREWRCDQKQMTYIYICVFSYRYELFTNSSCSQVAPCRMSDISTFLLLFRCKLRIPGKACFSDRAWKAWPGVCSHTPHGILTGEHSSVSFSSPLSNHASRFRSGGTKKTFSSEIWGSRLMQN